MKRLFALLIVAVVLRVACTAQTLSEFVKTSISFDKDRYARGTLLTGSTTTRDAFGNVVAIPARVDFYWSSDIRGLTYIGSLTTTTGRVNIGGLGYSISRNVNDDNNILYAKWIPLVPTFLGEPTFAYRRIPVGT